MAVAEKVLELGDAVEELSSVGFFNVVAEYTFYPAEQGISFCTDLFQLVTG